MPEKVVVSWSGGKDSALALQKLIADSRYQVEGLFSTISKVDHRLPIHEVKEALLSKQAAALGFPLTTIAIPQHPSNAVYEQKLAAYFSLLKEKGITTIVYADLFLEDIRSYRDELIQRHGMNGLYPLWGNNTGDVGQSFVEQGFEAIVTTIDTEKMEENWIGKLYNRHFLEKLTDSIDPCGENGEFHTFVFNGPIFHSVVEVEKGVSFRTMDGRFLHIDLIGK